jgi:hypothetical protein
MKTTFSADSDIPKRRRRGWRGVARLDLVGFGWISLDWGVEGEGDFALHDGMPYPSQGVFYPLARKPCVIAMTYKSPTR